MVMESVFMDITWRNCIDEEEKDTSIEGVITECLREGEKRNIL